MQKHVYMHLSIFTCFPLIIPFLEQINAKIKTVSFLSGVKTIEHNTLEEMRNSIGIWCWEIEISREENEKAKQTIVGCLSFNMTSWWQLDETFNLWYLFSVSFFQLPFAWEKKVYNSMYYRFQLPPSKYWISRILYFLLHFKH